MKDHLIALSLLAAAPLPAATVDERLDRLESEVAELKQMLHQLSSHSPTRPTRSEPASRRSYTIRKGDSLWSIARRHGTTVEAIKRANPKIKARALRIGQRIALSTRESSSPPNRPSTSPRLSGNTYTVRSGDILGRISEAHGIRLHQLLSANPGLNPRRLKIGTVLQIPDSLGSTKVARVPELDPTLTPPPVVIPEPVIETSRPEPSKPKRHDRPNPYLALINEEQPEVARLDAAPETIEPPLERILVPISEDIRYVDLATTYNTSVSELNRVNQRNIKPLQMIQAGSELYVPMR